MSFLIFEFSYVRGRLVVKISMYAKFLRNGGQMDSLIPNPKSFLWRPRLQAPFSWTGIYFLVGSATFKVTNFTCALTTPRWPRFFCWDGWISRCSTGSFFLYGLKTLIFLEEQSVQLATSKLLACEQALHLWDIVKSRRARGTREETPKWGAGEFAMIALLSSAPRSSLRSSK